MPIDSKKLKKAKELYLQGAMIKDIASAVGVSSRSIYKWKAAGRLGERPGKTKEESPKTGGNKAKPKKARGSPEAAAERPRTKREPESGKGGLGNKNSQRHGAYASPRLDFLTDEESAIASSVIELKDEEPLMWETVALLTVRERRIMLAIQQYGGLSPDAEYVREKLKEETIRIFKDDAERVRYEEMIEERIASGERLPGETYKLETITTASAELVLRLEKELSTVQKQKADILEKLARLKLEREKLDAAKDMGALVAEDVTFYLPENYRRTGENAGEDRTTAGATGEVPGDTG